MVEAPVAPVNIERQTLVHNTGAQLLERFGPQLPVFERLTTALFGQHSEIPLGIALSALTAIAIVEFQSRFPTE